MPEDADFPKYCPNCGAKMMEYGTCTEDDMKLQRIQAFEKGLRDMFSTMWDCKIEQEVFEDTVGDLMKAVVLLAENIFKE